MGLRIEIRTLTPLWTGGVGGMMDRLHETGLLGSLRWWYEAIIRGLGGYACNPTEKEKCELTDDRLKRYERAFEAGKSWWEALDEAGICDACKVFGTTGWQRRFRMEARWAEDRIDPTEGMFPSGRIHPDRQGGYRTGGWLLRGGYQGELTLHFTGDELVLCCELLPTLRLIEKWGALGAKTSLGYGVFQIHRIALDKEQQDIKGRRNLCSVSRVGRWWWDGSVPNVAQYKGILPALSNMFFAKVRFFPEDDQWWRCFPEVQWLTQGSVSEKQAVWMSNKARPDGPYNIQNPLSIESLKQWVECNGCFPLAPILRNFLRYKLLCNHSNKGESNWCNFIFGTVRGRPPICGYCGHPVHEDGQGNWSCQNGGISLDSSQVVREGQRIQSKIRISWAYKAEGRGSDEWEIRVWGWLPRSESHPNIPNVLNTLRDWLQNKDSIAKAVTLPAQLVDWWLGQTKVVDALKRLRDDKKESQSNP